MSVPPLDTAHAQLASPFGWRKLRGVDDLHTGIDLAAAIGEPVLAVAGGRVVVSAAPGQLGGYGNVIVVEHTSSVSRPVYSLYAHLSSRAVALGDRVVEGEIIGAVGNTSGARGETDKHFLGPHLHFELLTKWPPSGKDLDRLDPTRLWPPAIAPASSTKKKSAPQPSAARAAGSGLAFLLGAGLAFRAWRQYKKQRRQTY